MKFDDCNLFIFDMDGILVDTERIFMDDIVLISKKYGYDIDKNYLYNNLGNTNEKSSIYMKKLYGNDYDYTKLANEVDDLHMEKAKEKQIPLKKGVIEILEFLKKENKKLAVASSSNYDRMKVFLESNNILNYFDYIISGESLIESKPNKEIFEKVTKYFNISEKNTVIFEDSLNGLKASYSLGAYTVFIPDLIEENNNNRPYFNKKYINFLSVVKNIQNNNEI